MKNPFKGMVQGIKAMNTPQVKLKFSTCGEVLIDGLPFAFGVQSDGISSSKGLVVAISGDAVNDGELKLERIEVNIFNGGKVKSLERKLQRVQKKDGKYIFQARFPEIMIPVCPKRGTLGMPKKKSEDELIAELSSEISFKTTPKYTGKDEREVMITVYPIENPLNGLAVNWKNCTSDRDYFVHKFEKE